eukprot:CAMPEP_0168488326 /NCGR_PEP_ID=MMETSP0228-20121227/68093_1 /TAXON_ID=133427 /ORGANISM="Protoceratium reticulatum, Strain CCCM 535 (=CCMP 1889)" /LENGTH=65 /DNA_ID=CAMNT_0008504969 /DNA_START=1 /DNA_END=194 /DNA_ORIENTATION=+
MGSGRRAAALLLQAAFWRPGLALCPDPGARPAEPQSATGLNGVAWPELCFEEATPGGEEHFFVLG